MYQRILVPVDGSPTSSKGLDEAIQLARLTGAALRLIHVVDLVAFATGFEPYGVFAGSLIPTLRETGEKILAQGVDRVQATGLRADSALIENLGTRVSNTVIEHAKTWGADLIVVGTHGRRGVTRWLLGSDAEQMVRMAPVPVLLVRAPKVPDRAPSASHHCAASTNP